jgi:choline dehydrogenase-like flavoprotein
MPSHDDDVSRPYDVIVVGAGPAGEAAAELGGNLGYSVALVERDTVGGTVITSGGAPTKTFREAAVDLSSFGKEKIYGIALPAPPEVMYPAVRARARQVSEQLRQARCCSPPAAASAPRAWAWRRPGSRSTRAAGSWSTPRRGPAAHGSSPPAT